MIFKPEPRILTLIIFIIFIMCIILSLYFLKLYFGKPRKSNYWEKILKDPKYNRKKENDGSKQ